jgi:hypothetical protein
MNTDFYLWKSVLIRDSTEKRHISPQRAQRFFSLAFNPLRPLPLCGLLLCGGGW